MVRKKVVKKVAKKRVAKEKSVKVLSSSDKNLSKNFIELQKVLVVQSMKIDKLTTQVSGLLELFSSSAKALAKKEFGPGNSQEISKMNDKLDNLFVQNKEISSGIKKGMSVASEPMYSPTIDSSPAPLPVFAPALNQQIPQASLQVPVLNQQSPPQIPQLPAQIPVNGFQNQAQNDQESQQPSVMEA